MVDGKEKVSELESIYKQFKPNKELKDRIDDLIKKMVKLYLLE